MKNLDMENIRGTLKKLITDLLENKIDRNAVAKSVRECINEEDILNLEDRLSRIAYWTMNGLDYEFCNTTDSELLYLRECFEEVRKYSDEEKWDYILNNTEPICKMIPSLKGQEINSYDFARYTPEKFELYDGLIFGDKIKASKLLALLMTNVGIETVIKLAPREVWEEAINSERNK